MKYEDPNLLLEVENKIPAFYVSLTGQPKFYTMAGMLLEAAGTHAVMHGFGYHDMIRNNVYWVLSRFHLKVHAYPEMNDTVIVKTWPRGPEKLFFIRDYFMESEKGEKLMSATSAWLILDGKSGRPKKFEDANLGGFRMEKLLAIEPVPGKLPAIPEPDRVNTRIAQYSDLDINRHVNAAKYMEWIQNCYGAKDYQSGNIKELQINYRLETRFGEEVDIHIRDKTSDDPFDYFEGIRSADGKTAFRSKVMFGHFK